MVHENLQVPISKNFPGRPANDKFKKPSLGISAHHEVRVAIMFTDLKGSTELYDVLGDAAAYNLVRDHFAFRLDRVQRNHGFVVKTVGDAVMAAFSRPDGAVRAAPGNRRL